MNPFKFHPTQETNVVPKFFLWNQMSVYPVYGGFRSHRATIYGGYPQFSSRWGFSPETIQLLGYPSFAQPGGDDGDDHDEDRDVDGHQADHQITYVLKGLASFTFAHGDLSWIRLWNRHVPGQEEELEAHLSWSPAVGVQLEDLKFLNGTELIWTAIGLKLSIL